MGFFDLIKCLNLPMSSFKPLVYFKPLVSMVKGMTFVCSLFAAETEKEGTGVCY